MPEELDLEAFRGKGLQEGEVELSDEPAPAAAAAAAPAADEIDMGVVQQLMSMGFSVRKRTHRDDTCFSRRWC